MTFFVRERRPIPNVDHERNDFGGDIDGASSNKKRGADPHVPEKPKHEKPDRASERKLEQGLEESMAGSDPVSIVQPMAGKTDKRRNSKRDH